MNRFTFLLFLSAFAFLVCVSQPPNDGHSVLITKIRNFDEFRGVFRTGLRRELFKSYLLNHDLTYDYVDYQGLDLVEDRIKNRELLEAEETTAECNSNCSLFRRVENDPLKLRFYTLDLLTALSNMGDQSSWEFHRLLRLQKGLDQASGLSLFSSQPTLIAGTQVLSYGGFSIVYRLMDRFVFRAFLDRALVFLTLTDAPPGVIAAVQSLVNELDAAGVNPRRVSWCPVMPVEHTTNSEVQLGNALRQIQGYQKYLDSVGDDFLPATVQEKQNLATFFSVVMAKVQVFVPARHDEYERTVGNPGQAPYYYNNRLAKLGRGDAFSAIYGFYIPGVLKRYIENLQKVESHLGWNRDHYFSAALKPLNDAHVVAEDSFDTPIKQIGDGREDLKSFVDQMLDLVLRSGPVSEERKGEYALIEMYKTNLY